MAWLGEVQPAAKAEGFRSVIRGAEAPRSHRNGPLSTGAAPLYLNGSHASTGTTVEAHASTGTTVEAHAPTGTAHAPTGTAHAPTGTAHAPTGTAHSPPERPVLNGSQASTGTTVEALVLMGATESKSVQVDEEKGCSGSETFREIRHLYIDSKSLKSYDAVVRRPETRHFRFLIFDF
jgi:hypothetical protein